MATVPFESFNPKTDNFDTFCERLEIAFEANDTTDAKKTAVFLTILGKETYEILRALTTPKVPAKETYKILKDALSAYFNPKPNVTAERFRFSQRAHSDNESISEFIADLRRLSINCDFAENLEDRLKDKIVEGIKNKQILNKLLQEKDLTYKKAVEIATAWETTAKDVGTILRKPATEVDIHSINKEQAPKTHYETSSSGTYGSGKPSSECTNCGYTHSGKSCPASGATCHKCKKVGHFARMCRSSGNKSQRGRANPPGRFNRNHYHPKSYGRVNNLEVENVEHNPTQFLPFGSISTNFPVPAITVRISIQNLSLDAELDTGSAVSAISEATYREHLSSLPLRETNIALRPYDGKTITPLGVIYPVVTYNGNSVEHPFFVIRNGGNPLVGRDWLKEFQVSLASVNSLKSWVRPESILEKHEKLFEPGLGKLKNFTASLHLREDAKPVYRRPRPIPFAIKAKIDKVLDWYVAEGIYEPTDRSEWATPVVYVKKLNGDYRPCGDYKDTVNPNLVQSQKYPLPRPEEILAKLAGGQKYSTIDLKWAYSQICLDEKSQEITTLSTHRGLFKVKRLAVGLSPAAEIFQRAIDQVIGEMPGVGIFQDDLIITAKTTEEHLSTLDAVMGKLEEAGFKV